jgi:hypothetical protein
MFVGLIASPLPWKPQENVSYIKQHHLMAAIKGTLMHNLDGIATHHCWK